MIKARKNMTELPKSFRANLMFKGKMILSPELSHLKKLRGKGNNIPVNVFGVTRITGEKLLLWFTPIFQPGIERCALAQHFDIQVNQIPPESLKIIPFFNK